MTKEERIKAAEVAYPQYPNDMDQRYNPFRSGDIHCHKKRKAFIKGAEAEAESKWISVSERNPEPIPENYKKHFLVFLDLCKSSTIGYYHENKWITYGSFTGNVTHWQPLPQPPLNRQ